MNKFDDLLDRVGDDIHAWLLGMCRHSGQCGYKCDVTDCPLSLLTDKDILELQACLDREEDADNDDYGD